MSAEPSLRSNHRWKAISGAQAERYGLDASQPAGRTAVGDVRVSDTWLEVPLKNGWIAAYRLTVDQGTKESSFAELRIFPADDMPREPGEWSAEFLGLKAKVPTKALTLAVIRQASPERHKKALAKILANIKQRQAERAFGSVTVPRRGAGRLGGRPERAEFYAKLAVEYDELENGEERRRGGRTSTRRLLSEEYQVPVTTIAGWIRSARALGFLEGTKPGRRGGQATESARQVLGEDIALMTRRAK